MAQTAYTSNCYIFSDFLTLAEQSDVLAMEKELPAAVTFFGGYDGGERCMARFGTEEELGYEVPFPITVLKVSPVNAKFSDKMTHRDYLGAILNLGIERKVVGDILTDGTEGYVFVSSNMAGFISESLERVKHTSVKVSETNDVPEQFVSAPKESFYIVPSLRIDAVISKIYNVSRKEAQQAVTSGHVFINSRTAMQYTYQLEEKDLVSVRGFGRFRFKGVVSDTRKGNLKIAAEVY